MSSLVNQCLGRIHQLGSPALRIVANAVPPSMFGTSALYGLVKNMVESMTAANGAGIAAPQIGESWRVFVVHGTGTNPRYPYKPAVPLTIFVNPEIEILDATPMHIIEGCLSVPGMRGRVSRASHVRCSAYHLDGTKFVMRAQDGVLFPDHTGSGGLMTQEAFEKYHRDAFFTYAMDINALYPEPLTWEEGNPPDAAALRVLLESAPPLPTTVPSGESSAEPITSQLDSIDSKYIADASARQQKVLVHDTRNGADEVESVTYAADLTWTGAKFERNIHVTVTGDGRIRSVHRATDANTDAAVEDVIPLSHGALLPGFVNAHSHAFQRGLRGLGEDYPTPSSEYPPPSFWTWRDAMYGLVRDLDTAEAFKQQTLQCFKEMAAAGITTCGEFHYFRHVNNPTCPEEEDFGMDQTVIDAAREANVRLVLLSAVYQRGGFDNRPLGAGQQRFRTSDLGKYWEQMDHLQTMLDPLQGEALGAVVHSLRAVGVPELQQIASEAHRRNLPLHVHLEEQPQEIADCYNVHGVTPLALLLQAVPPEHLTRLCAGPLTEAALGDGVFKALEETQGVVSVGTDCNARIDMFEEMRWLEYSQRLSRGQRGIFPSMSTADKSGDLSRQLLDCATVHGAKHLATQTGSITSGNWADFALMDLNATALAGVTDDGVLGAAIFGGSAEDLVVNSCVAGTWTEALCTTNPRT